MIGTAPVSLLYVLNNKIVPSFVVVVVVNPKMTTDKEEEDKSVNPVGGDVPFRLGFDFRRRSLGSGHFLHQR